MPEERGGIRRLEHIPLGREPDIEPERRRRRYFSRVAARDRRQHGSDLEKAYDDTVDQLLQERQISGIAPERLLVIELEALDARVRDELEERFQLVVVDEGTTEDGRSRLLVQFADTQALQRFRQEVQRYQEDTEARSDILTQSQRRELFDRIESARALAPEERMGPRLKDRGWPQASTFYLDVDIWHPGDLQHAQEVQQSIRQFCGGFGGRVTDETRTETLLLAKIQANQQLGNELLKLDLVARVELPPEIREASLRVLRDDVPSVSLRKPTSEEARVCILDSGVVAGHPLLQGWVEEERDFDSGEGTEVDLHGHGTQVAGLVVYGDIAGCLESGVFEPQVMICSAKVLRRDPEQLAAGLPPDAVFPDEHRIEKITEDAIRDFHTRRGCRVFNLSLGSSEIYEGTRQFAWAEKLDQLVRELDIVIVVSAGNRSDPPIPLAGPGREDFQKAVVRQMAAPEQRLCNPATAALAITVGAIARSDRCRAPDAIPAAPTNAPSPFSRVGFGYEVSATKRAVKPDCVAHGGNYALQTLGGARKRWVKQDVYLGEPTIALPSTGRSLCAPSGTSFASPQIANLAARAEVALRRIVPVPSANLVRALVGATTVRPAYPINWIGDDETDGDSKLRIVGYGVCNEESALGSSENDVLLVAEDRLPEDRFHIYQIYVPSSFISVRGRRGVTVALGFDPPVRAGRRDYLARTMWIEAYKGLTTAEVENYRRHHRGTDAPSVPQSKLLDLGPPKTVLQWSTLQVRRKVWSRSPQLPLVSDLQVPVIHVLVGCRSRFRTDDPDQKYALAVRLWHDG